MAKQPPIQGGKVPMKNMLIALPEELHRQVKLEAVKAGRSMKDFVTEAIRNTLKKGGGTKT